MILLLILKSFSVRRKYKPVFRFYKPEHEMYCATHRGRGKEKDKKDDKDRGTGYRVVRAARDNAKAQGAEEECFQ